MNFELLCMRAASLSLGRSGQVQLEIGKLECVRLMQVLLGKIVCVRVRVCGVR